MELDRIVNIDGVANLEKTFLGSQEYAALVNKLIQEQKQGWDGVTKPNDDKGAIIKQIVELVSTVLEDQDLTTEEFDG
jgi:hypothetical protein